MIQEIDQYFPYLVLFYGTIMVLITTAPGLQDKAKQSMNPELVNWFYSHRLLGIVSVFVGGLWTLQRLLI